MRGVILPRRAPKPLSLKELLITRSLASLINTSRFKPSLLVICLQYRYCVKSYIYCVKNLKMSSLKAPSLCLLCSCRSIELKQFGKSRKGVMNTKSFQKTHVGMKCSKCNGFVCVDCLTVLVPIITKDVNHFASSSLLRRLEEALFSITSTGVTHRGHIGHCCDVYLQHEEKNIMTSTVEKTKTHLKTVMKCSSSSVVENSLPPTPCSTELVGRLSGCVFFPEFDIFIDSPLECMDIHAVGAEVTISSNRPKRKFPANDSSRKERNCYLEARWHCVVPPEVAAAIHDISPLPNNPIPNHWEVVLLHNIKVATPHNQNDFMVRYLIIVCHISFNLFLFHSFFYPSCLLLHITFT